MVAELKDVRITITVGESDQTMIGELADAEDLSVSHLVRVLVRKAHAERFKKTTKK